MHDGDMPAMSVKINDEVRYFPNSAAAPQQAFILHVYEQDVDSYVADSVKLVANDVDARLWCEHDRVRLGALYEGSYWLPLP